MRVGVVGGGQLARMLALAAHPLDIRVSALCASRADPACAAADAVRATEDVVGGLRELARMSDVLTFESENVDVGALRDACQAIPCHPSLDALALVQDRLLQKRHIASLGLPLARFESVDTREDLLRAVEVVGAPAILKTRRGGYDGRGQCTIRDGDDVEAAWAAFGGRPLVLEEFVEFDRELALVSVRGRDGEIRFYPLVENLHAAGVLRATRAPACRIPHQLGQRAREQARVLLESLDYVGVLTIELFERDGETWINELAPRVHNSGHWTIEGASTSQFESHLRAICGFPLGTTDARGHSVMINLLGSLPARESLLALDGVRVHLYSKSPAAGRKLGHITICGDEQDALAARIREALRRLDGDARDLLRRITEAGWIPSTS